MPCVIGVECSHPWDSALFQMEPGSGPTYYIQNVLKCNTGDSVSRKMSHTVFMMRTGKLEWIKHCKQGWKVNPLDQ